jgi:hypothetical protein
MPKPVLSEAIAHAFGQADLVLPASFAQLPPTHTDPAQRVYLSGAACSYYRAAQYQVYPFYKHPSRVIDYGADFTCEEVS